MSSIPRLPVRLWVAIAGLSVGMATAQEVQERQYLLEQATQVTRDPAKRQAAIEAARERTVLCSQCHGKDGNSLRSDVPNLAGQNPTYLLQQIEKFTDGRRKNFVMQSLARSFTMEDKVNLAVYFSSRSVKPVKADSALAAKGRDIFHQVCSACHGVDGKGEAGYARLAGQQVQYVRTTLRRFRQNARHQGETGDMTRHSFAMEQVAKDLSDRDIDSLAAYIALLH